MEQIIELLKTSGYVLTHTCHKVDYYEKKINGHIVNIKIDQFYSLVTMSYCTEDGFNLTKSNAGILTEEDIIKFENKVWALTLINFNDN